MSFGDSAHDLDVCCFHLNMLFNQPSPFGAALLCPVLYCLSTTLDWVHGLQPDDLEKFLAEKKEQRLRVLCLDLEPTGIPQQVRV